MAEIFSEARSWTIAHKNKKKNYGRHAPNVCVTDLLSRPPRDDNIIWYLLFDNDFLSVVRQKNSDFQDLTQGPKSIPPFTP